MCGLRSRGKERGAGGICEWKCSLLQTQGARIDKREWRMTMWELRLEYGRQAE